MGPKLFLGSQHFLPVALARGESGSQFRQCSGGLRLATLRLPPSRRGFCARRGLLNTDPALRHVPYFHVAKRGFLDPHKVLNPPPLLLLFITLLL
jgi:hypothetical protein